MFDYSPEPPVEPPEDKYITDVYGCEVYDGDTFILFKLKELWAYFANDFENADKHLKKIRKSKKITEYEDAVERLFSDCEFRI